MLGSNEKPPGSEMIESELRDRILAEPELLLDDRDVMNALVAANERAMGTNIVDLRGIAMQRLESRLDRLEDTHRAVIAAAYANLSGANQVHRAVLLLLGASRFEDFLSRLFVDIVPVLQVSCVRLILETRQETGSGDAAIEGMVLVGPGAIAAHVGAPAETGVRPVTLRPVAPTGASSRIYGRHAADIRSEALVMLDLGEGRLPGLVAFGADDPHQFRPTQGSDLLVFLGEVIGHILRRWLS